MQKIIENSRFYKLYRLKIQRANETLSLLSALLLLLFVAADQTYQAHERRFMISEIQMTALVTGLHTGLYKVDQKVLQAMARVPRNEFLDTKFASYAYKNVALPMRDEKYIIPEPFLTAMMIHLMGVNKKDRVLEIGFGTGYEAVVLSKLVKDVYSIQQKNPLKATVQHSYNDYTNITAKIGNGLFGWAKHGPYDAILVKQALEDVPPKLIEQLNPYGRLVIPIENEYGEQRVIVYLKMPDGTIEQRKTLHVKMTPLLPGRDI
ncbi:MAG: protein-L-isoaspartate O-methyltransferase family protein [Alphaproteobacteria bacterium]